VSPSASIVRALEYLCCAQSRAGFWSEWQLPPGESRMWTTAYIGYRLSSLANSHRSAVAEHLDRAAAWLCACGFPNGGWGYSDQTGPDADSTSLAILFLSRLKQPVSEDSLRCLAEFQQSDGGFATYTPAWSWGAWTESHPEVTAAALLAALTARPCSDPGIARGLDYLRGRQRADGLWNSFWWTSCLYATEAALAVLNSADEPLETRRLLASLGQVSPAGAFEVALLLLCLIRTGCERESLCAENARALFSAQLPDGSWPACPMLRLTSREISEPWAVRDAGPVFDDERRLFTTATAAAALSAFFAALGRD
jgi:hypothetical protein